MNLTLTWVFAAGSRIRTRSESKWCVWCVLVSVQNAEERCVSQ